MENPKPALTQGSDPDGDVGFIDTGKLSAGQDTFHSPTDRAPTATLAIYRNRLIITDRFPRRIYDLARSDVIRIVEEDVFWLFRQLRIVHARRDYPPFIAFSPLNPEQVIEGFRRVGYTVEVL